MSAFTKTVLAAVAAIFILPLGACETVEGWTDHERSSEATTAPLSTPPPSIARLDNAPGVRPVPQFPVPGDRDLKVMTSKLSGGAVEIYDIDGIGDTATMGAPVPPVTPDYLGIPMASNPNVTIYPLDGNNNYPGELRPVPNMAPPSVQQWPNSVLPAGQVSSSGMTPPPDSFGGDKPMAIVNGKLTSRAGNDVSNIYFPYGSANLSGKDQSVLTNVAETAKFAPVDRVSVEGHASVPTQTDDPVKAKILNLKESMNRAAAVSSTLIEKGVPAEKIKTVGWGDTKISSGNEAEQRRVDVITGAGQ